MICAFHLLLYRISDFNQSNPGLILEPAWINQNTLQKKKYFGNKIQIWFATISISWKYQIEQLNSTRYEPFPLHYCLSTCSRSFYRTLKRYSLSWISTLIMSSRVINKLLYIGLKNLKIIWCKFLPARIQVNPSPKYPSSQIHLDFPIFSS